MELKKQTEMKFPQYPRASALRRAGAGILAAGAIMSALQLSSCDRAENTENQQSRSTADATAEHQTAIMGEIAAPQTEWPLLVYGDYRAPETVEIKSAEEGQEAPPEPQDEKNAG